MVDGKPLPRPSTPIVLTMEFTSSVYSHSTMEGLCNPKDYSIFRLRVSRAERDYLILSSSPGGWHPGHPGSLPLKCLFFWPSTTMDLQQCETKQIRYLEGNMLLVIGVSGTFQTRVAHGTLDEDARCRCVVQWLGSSICFHTSLSFVNKPHVCIGALSFCLHKQMTPEKEGYENQPPQANKKVFGVRAKGCEQGAQTADFHCLC